LLLIGIMNIMKSNYLEPFLILEARSVAVSSLLHISSVWFLLGIQKVFKNECSHTHCPFVYVLVWLCSQSAKVLEYVVPPFDAAVLAKRVQMLRTSN
jgi:hypothetical protein